MQIAEDQRAMHADHAARGLLASGNTIKRAVAIYQERTEASIDLCTDAITRRLESRGRGWKKAMQQVREALLSHQQQALDLLEPSYMLATLPDKDGARLIRPLLDRADLELRERVDAFEEGWTSPRGKKWIERHPALYAVAFLVLGALISAAVPWAIKHSRSLLMADPPVSSATPHHQ